MSMSFPHCTRVQAAHNAQTAHNRETAGQGSNVCARGRILTKRTCSGFRNKEQFGVQYVESRAGRDPLPAHGGPLLLQGGPSPETQDPEPGQPGRDCRGWGTGTLAQLDPCQPAQPQWASCPVLHSPNCMTRNLPRKPRQGSWSPHGPLWPLGHPWESQEKPLYWGDGAPQITSPWNSECDFIRRKEEPLQI